VAAPAPPPAPAGNQRRVVIALVVVLVVLLVALALVVGLLLGKNPAGTPTSSLVSSPSSQPSSSPTAVASAPGSTEISGAGSLLGPGPGSDPSTGRGNGPGCGIWVDPSWTLGDCGIVPVNGTNSSDQAIAYVTEHEPGASGVRWRVFIMTSTATDAYWHTKLYYSDDLGGGMVNITVKGVDTTGGGRPDLMLGFRHNKTSGGGTVLDYDVIMRSSATAPLAIAMHRQLADGSVVIVGGHVNDYGASTGGEYTRSDITFSGGLFRLAATSRVAQGAVPASLLP
jgi:hypothetical protein